MGWLWGVAVACIGACVALGSYVAPRVPLRLDVAGASLLGHGTPAAVAFTRLGRWYAVTSIAIGAAVAAHALGGSVSGVAALFGAQLAAQSAVNALKFAFRRPRPDDWLHRFERGFSYPSGHAATAGLFFPGLVLLLAHWAGVPSAVFAALAGVLIVCSAGIAWSRVALGAHYPTDVGGGLLFGAGCLAALSALTPRGMIV